jgi:hypothetical protein
MLAASLVFGSFLTILFFIMGLTLGWVGREYLMNYRDVPQFHPEMYDQNGNIIPDEILAVRFENDYDDDIEDED